MVQYARLGIDQIATGHYAESVMTQSQDATSCEGRSVGSVLLLYDLTQELLAASLFPWANRSKRKLDVLQLSLD